ncbi:17621_t:CDS:2, partial [Racocetra fulgida]
MKNLTTVILTILVTFLAIIYTLYKNWLVLSGCYREPAQKYNGGKCRYLEDKQSRKTIPWPPPGPYNDSFHLRGVFYVYNIEADKLTPLILKNFSDKEDFSLHGFGIYESPTEPDNLYFFIINHKRSGKLLIYERKPDNKLKLLDVINVEHPIDNVNVDPVTGEIYLAVAHSLVELGTYLSGLDKSKKPSFGVIKISNNTEEDKFNGIKYVKEKIFEDDGTLFHAASVAA